MFRFCVRFNKNGQLTQNRRPIEIVGPSLAGALTVADLRAPLRSLTPGPPAGEDLAFAIAARSGRRRPRVWPLRGRPDQHMSLAGRQAGQ